jgi:hypothetical protein
MSESRVFVSPGIYTSERDLTYVARQVGVTTLGLVGETTIGPAFQPIFISNYNEFQSFFGGLDNTLIKDTGAPKYELAYIAKSYLSQSNQLFVTRVLGYSGYDAGLAWGITLDAAMDNSTYGITSGPTNVASLITYSATTGGTNVVVSSSVSLIQSLINNGTLTDQLAFLGVSNTGTTSSISPYYLKTGDNFSGVSFTLNVISTGTSGSYLTGTTSGVTTFYSGTSYSDVENKLVALLRSRGTVNQTTQLVDFEVTGATGVGFNPSVTGATTNPLGDFTLTGASTTQGAFSYGLSLDKTKRNYLPKVLGRGAQDGKTALFVEEFYSEMFENYNDDEKVRGVNLTPINYSNKFDDYLVEFAPAVTPYVVSELRGNKVLRLFRFWTISDGNAANEQFKISITNIKPDTKEFDVIVRGFYDTDANIQVLESFTRCTLDPESNNYIGKKIGTLDGEYASKSLYVLVEFDTENDISEAFPAGFIGYPVRDYNENGNSSVLSPSITYKTSYSAFENKRKYYLGLSNTIGIDADFFDYKGKPESSTLDMWTGLTKGFHMDIDATGATIDGVEIVINSSGGTYSPIFLFDTGDAEFRTEAGLLNTPYEKIYARKFTMAPYGGFDGWDIYRTRRSNQDSYTINGTKGAAGLLVDTFANRTLTNGDLGITSDYYAYLEAIWTFNNPEAININVLATPGIDTFDNSNLVEATIDMIQDDRSDSLYIVTTPDTDASGDVISAADVADSLDGLYDSSYTATYWPWIQILDSENNAYVYVPPTRDVVRNIALTDNISYSWFAVAGLQRGNVDAIKARKKLTVGENETLLDARVNPIFTFNTEGIKIWGNKTALNRINVRRLLLQTRKLISSACLRLIFEQNDSVVRSQFLAMVNPILNNIRTQRGLIDFRVAISDAPEDLDRNELNATIWLKPTRSLEFIKIDFVLTNAGASFDDI